MEFACSACVHVWGFLGYSNFLLKIKNIPNRLTGNSRLPVGVCLWGRGGGLKWLFVYV